MSPKTLAGGLVLLALFARPVAAIDEDEAERRIEQLERQQEQLTEELDRLRRELKQNAVAPTPEPVPARAEAEPERVEEVERRQGIMAEELRRLREALVLPETAELKSAYGLGPAASKVYGIERGLSIGGYGETNFKAVLSDKDGEKNEFDFVRFILYTGYKYNDWIVLNTELEFEHATTGGTVSASDGSVSLEFATLDFLLHPMANLRGGLMLLPIGFVNEIHEPPFYLGNVRPDVERNLIPSTWRANGVGFFGELLPGLEYRTYGLTSLNAEGFTGAEGLRKGRQSGNRETANTWSWVGRLDYTPWPELLVGGSAYVGDQGQGQSYGNPDDDIGERKAGVFTQLYELHAQVQTHGLELRALGSYVHLDDTAALSRDPDIDGPIGRVMLGGYAEAAYNVLPLLVDGTNQYLAPWFRYSWYDTNNSVPSGFTRDRRQRRWLYEFGLGYKPIPQVVLKLDYHIQQQEQGTAPDELRVGAGFVF